MKATLQPDGSIALTAFGQTRVFGPSHASYQSLSASYSRHANVALSSAPIVKPKQKDDEDFQLSAGYGGFPWKKGMPDHDETYHIPLEYLHVDPDRFQFKEFSDENTGVTSELDEDAFDPECCDELAVWKDPDDGLTYVVDGHHRRELAERAGVDTMPAKYIEAKTAREAKIAGARMNGYRGRVALSGGLFDEEEHPRDEGGKWTHKQIKGEHVKAAKKAFAKGKLGVKHSAEPIISDASGANINHYVEFEGHRVHPDELHRLRVDEDGKDAVLHHDEGLTIHEPGGHSRATSFENALHKVTQMGKAEEPVTIVSNHGYSATRPRHEWAKMRTVRSESQPSFSEWYDAEGHQHTGRRVEHDGGATLASEEDTGRLFEPASAGQGRLDFLLSSSDSDGHWVQIGGQAGEDGKKHGGSPVYIQNGRITKGHPSLTGKKISNLDEPAEPSEHHKKLADAKALPERTDIERRAKAKAVGTHNASISRADAHQEKGYHRAVMAKKARKEGIDPAHLHSLASEMKAHYNAHVADVTKLLQETRKAASSAGGTGSNLSHLNKAFESGDHTQVKGFDLLASQMAAKYPHILGDHGVNVEKGYDADVDQAAEKLFTLLQAGNPAPMTDDQAYDHAFDFLSERKSAETQREPGDEDAAPRRARSLRDSVDDVPFSAADPHTVSAAVQTEAIRALRARFPISEYAEDDVQLSSRDASGHLHKGKGEGGGHWVTLESDQRVFIGADGVLRPSGPGGTAANGESEKSPQSVNNTVDLPKKGDKIPSTAAKEPAGNLALPGHERKKIMSEAVIAILIRDHGFSADEASYVAGIYLQRFPQSSSMSIDDADLIAEDAVSWHGKPGSRGTAGQPVSPFATR